MHLTSLLSIATCLLTLASAAPTPEQAGNAKASVEARDRHHCPSGWFYDNHHHGCYRHCDHGYEWDWGHRHCEHRGHHDGHHGHHGHKRDVELEERDRHHCPSGWFYDNHHHGCYRHCDRGYEWDWNHRRCEHRGHHDGHHGHHGHKRDLEEGKPAVEKREAAVELEERDRHHCPSGWFYDNHHHGCYRHCDHGYEWDWHHRRCEHRGHHDGHHDGHHGHKRDVEESAPAVEKREPTPELQERDRHHCPSGWFYDNHHHACYRHCERGYEWDWNHRRCEHRGHHDGHHGHHGHKRDVEESSAVEKRDVEESAAVEKRAEDAGAVAAVEKREPAVELEERDRHHCPSGWFYDNHHHGCYRHCDHDYFWDWNHRRCEHRGHHGGHHGH